MTHPRILLWADINPEKRGSYEDFLLNLGREARHRDLQLALVTGNQVTPTIVTQLRQSQVEYFPLPIHSLKQPAVLRKYLRSVRPDLVHLHFVPPCSPLIPTIRLFSKARLIMTDHASSPLQVNDNWRLPKKLRRSVYAALVHRYIAVSEFVARRISTTRWGVKHKITQLYNGVAMDRFKPLPHDQQWNSQRQVLFQASPQQTVALFVGQLRHEKGLEDFLSLAGLFKDHAGAVFAVSGDGPLHPLMTQSGNPRFHYLGLHGDIDHLLALADVVVCPSRWGEAFCLVLAEAAACGTVTIATNVGGIPEVVADGKTGFLVPVGDIDSMQSHLLSLLDSAALLAGMQSAARNRAEQLFDLDAITRHTVNLYMQELGYS